MNSALRDLAQLPLVDRLGWTLIHFVWQAMVVSVFAAAALRTFRNAKANHRYLGLCLCLLIVAGAPVATFLGLPGDAKFDSLNVASQDSAYQFIDGPNAMAKESFGVVDSDEGLGAEGQRSTRPTIDMHHVEGAAADSLSREARKVQTAILSTLRLSLKSLTPWIVAVWILGVGLFSVWHMAGWLLALHLTTHGTRPVSATAQVMLDGLLQRMGIRVVVRLWESTSTSVPIVVGWLKPVLLIPASVLSGLPPDHLQAILAHELAHVRRHDFLVNVLQTVVETCLFYHPGVWWLSRQIRIEREYCADEDAAAVCADRGVYARALVSLADSVMAVRGPVVAATGGSLTRRIQRILELTSDHERSTRHPSWLVSTVLGLAVIWGLLASTKSNAQLPDRSVKITPIDELAKRLGSTVAGWTLLEHDEHPSVVVGGHRGFHLVLRRTWKEFASNVQPQRALESGEVDGAIELRHEDWEFVLIPVQPRTVPTGIQKQIPWQESTSPYKTCEIYLGEGFGYMWFTRGTLYGQEFIRESLKLEGGDDRIQLAMDGLQVKDAGTNTANSCLHIPAKFGDRALPYIERTIAQARQGDDLWRVVGSLAFLQTERSTELLVKLYNSDNDDIKRAAQYALIQKPFRKSAKRAYFDMLQRQSSVESACPACVEFQWKDSVPILREVIASPRHLENFQFAIAARRTLEGQPISPELLDAEQTLLKWTSRVPDAESQEKLNVARRLLIQTTDTEAANLAALTLALARKKGGYALVNEAGREILQSRPRQATVEFLKTLAMSADKEFQPQIEELLNLVANASLPVEP